MRIRANDVDAFPEIVLDGADSIIAKHGNGASFLINNAANFYFQFQRVAVNYITSATSGNAFTLSSDTVTTGTALRIDASSLNGKGAYVDFDSDFVLKNEGITGIGHSTPTEMLTVKSNGTIGIANFSDSTTTSSSDDQWFRPS